MNANKPLFIATLLLSLLGCRSAFQPPPASFERWTKKGAHVQQVGAALLECGYPWPAATINHWLSAEGENWEAKQILADKCMESQGFVEKYGRGTASACKYYSYPETRKYSTAQQLVAIDQACDPRTPAPKPSVEMRLNSRFCKTEWAKNYPQCQPVVIPDLTPSRPHVNISIPPYSTEDRMQSQIEKQNRKQMDQLRR